MDNDGYPEENELKAIRTWDVKNFHNLIDFIEQRWTYSDFINRRITKTILGEPILEWTLITGGWSGNESLINALLANKNFEMLWYASWERGGKHVFLIDPRNVGFMQVADYCVKNGVTRQYISKAKHKFEYFLLSKNKVFIRPI